MRDLAYVRTTYVQAERIKEAPKGFQIPDVSKLKITKEDEREYEEEPEMKPGYMSSPYRIPYTTMGEIFFLF